MISRFLVSIRRCGPTLSVALLLGACADADAKPRDVSEAYTVRIDHVSSLDVEDGAILASANSLVRDRHGRIYIGDNSDRRIKVFGAEGSQQRPVGSPGAGPGEFITLFSAGLLGDSVYGWDASANRITVFGPNGERVRDFALRKPGSPSLSRIRTMDDSLLVASGWVAGAHDRPLVEIYDRAGTRLAGMMNLERVLSPPKPDFVQHSSVFADGTDGIVFSTMHGIDTLFAYTTDGTLLAAGRVGLTGFSPVLDLRELLDRTGGRLRAPDGSWAQDRHYAPLKLVALGGGLVAVQFGFLNFSAGDTDLLSVGGPVVILRLTSDGEFERVGQVEVQGALLGRSGPGEAYVLRWSGSELTELELFRLAVAPKPETTS